MEKIWHITLTLVFMYSLVNVSFGLTSGDVPNGLTLASHVLAIVVVGISFWRALHDGKSADKISEAIDRVASRIESLDRTLTEVSANIHQLDDTVGEASDDRKHRDLLVIDIEIAKLSGDVQQLKRLRFDRQVAKKVA